jgi:hypothetical protein
MYRTIGIKFLTVLIFSLLASSVSASDSLMDVREYMMRVYDILNLDSNGTKTLDTVSVREFTFDGGIRAYTDLGDPRTDKFAVTAGVSGIFIDEGLIRVVGIILDSNKTFQAMQRVEPHRFSDLSYYKNLTGKQSRPKYYLRHGDSINIYPRPGKNDTITVFYFARGAFPYGGRSDTVSVVMPVEYRWAVIYATAVLCEIRRGNFDRAAEFEKLYQQEVMRLRTRFELEGLTKQ